MKFECQNRRIFLLGSKKEPNFKEGPNKKFSRGEMQCVWDHGSCGGRWSWLRV